MEWIVRAVDNFFFVSGKRVYGSLTSRKQLATAQQLTIDGGDFSTIKGRWGNSRQIFRQNITLFFARIARYCNTAFAVHDITDLYMSHSPLS